MASCLILLFPVQAVRGAQAQEVVLQLPPAVARHVACVGGSLVELINVVSQLQIVKTTFLG